MSVITDIIGSIPTYHVWRQVGGYNRLNKQYKALISRRYDGLYEGDPPSLLNIDGYSSSPISLSTGFSDKDLFDNRAGSKVTIRMLAESISQLLLIARGDDTKYRVEVIDDGATLFCGYIRPETYRQEYERNRPVVTVDATDGIGLLRNVEFMGELADYSELTGKHKVTEVIGYLLWKAGNTFNWHDRINYSLPGHLSDNLLKHMEMPLWKYYGWTCHEVLVDILEIFNMQLVQIGGLFHIRLADQPYDEHRNTYNYKGQHQTKVSPITKDVISLDEFKGVQGDVRIERPVRIINFDAPQVAVGNLVYNGDMQDEQGWAGFNDIDDSMWEISDGILTMDFDTEIDEPYYGVKTDISRGAISGVQRMRLSFEGRADDAGPMAARIMISNSIPSMRHTSLGTTWETREVYIQIPGGTDPVEIQFITPFLSRIYIRKVSAVPLYPNKEAIQNIDNDSKETINEKSQQDITHNIDYAWGGNPYRFENAFPGLPAKTLSVYIRASGLQATPYSIQKARALTFYNTARMRVGLTAYKDETPLRIDDILYDKHYKRSYVITSLSYDMAEARYNIEALEHDRMFIDPPIEEDDWILADGTWNDEGFWRDEKEWIDSL